MNWTSIEELNLRKALSAGMTLMFLFSHWQMVIGAIYHVILTARTYNLEKIDGLLAENLAMSIIAFGHMTSNLVMFIVLWFIMDWAIQKFDPDMKYGENELAKLRRENAKLLKSVRTLHAKASLLSETVEMLSENVKQISVNNTHIGLHKDRIVELNFALDKHAQKTKKSKSLELPCYQAPEPDLFTSTKRQKTIDQKVRRRRGPPKRKKPLP